jgi:hypothetical protein
MRWQGDRLVCSAGKEIRIHLAVMGIIPVDVMKP